MAVQNSADGQEQAQPVAGMEVFQEPIEVEMNTEPIGDMVKITTHGQRSVCTLLLENERAHELGQEIIDAAKNE